MDWVEKGDTKTFQVTFQDAKTGEYIDPSEVAFRILDRKSVEIFSGIPTKVKVGIYEIDWTANVADGIYVYEFKGVVAGKDEIIRDYVGVKTTTVDWL